MCNGHRVAMQFHAPCGIVFVFCMFVNIYARTSSKGLSIRSELARLTGLPRLRRDLREQWISLLRGLTSQKRLSQTINSITLKIGRNGEGDYANSNFESGY